MGENECRNWDSGESRATDTLDCSKKDRHFLVRSSPIYPPRDECTVEMWLGAGSRPPPPARSPVPVHWECH